MCVMFYNCEYLCVFCISVLYCICAGIVSSVFADDLQIDIKTDEI